MLPKAVVYVLHRQDGSRHNLTKVGSTKISADSRAASYTDGGWVAYFTAEVSAHVRYAVEKKAHFILSEKGLWLDPNITGGTAHEIFTCTPREAREAILSAIQMVREELFDFMGDEIALNLKKTKNEMLDLAEELDTLKKHQKYEKLTIESQNIIREAGNINKLQEKIRTLEVKIIEKDKEISALRIELNRSNDALADIQYIRSRKKGR